MLAYQNGIVRMSMSDSSDPKDRFGITDINVGVEEQNLEQILSLQDVTLVYDDRLVLNLQSSDRQDHFEYEVQFQPFRVVQRINKVVTMVVNHNDTLYFENSKFFHRSEDRYEPNL